MGGTVTVTAFPASTSWLTPSSRNLYNRCGLRTGLACASVFGLEVRAPRMEQPVSFVFPAVRAGADTVVKRSPGGGAAFVVSLPLVGANGGGGAHVHAQGEGEDAERCEEIDTGPAACDA